MSKLLFLIEKLRQPDEPDFHTVRVSDTCDRGLGDYVILELYNMFPRSTKNLSRRKKNPVRDRVLEGWNCD